MRPAPFFLCVQNCTSSAPRKNLRRLLCYKVDSYGNIVRDDVIDIAKVTLGISTPMTAGENCAAEWSAPGIIGEAR